MAPMAEECVEVAGVVGVLGGMGPLATLDFLRKMLEATPAAVDQEHVPVVVSSLPQVPDRTAAFRGEGESPLAAMVASARRLVAAGAGWWSCHATPHTSGSTTSTRRSDCRCCTSSMRRSRMRSTSPARAPASAYRATASRVGTRRRRWRVKRA